MDELIEALNIFKRYLNKEDYAYTCPTNCYHGEMRVSVHPKNVLDEDEIRLQELGFQPDYYYGNFVSVKYGRN